jgi:hypothetical protein
MMGLTTLNNAQVPKDLTDWCPERLRSVDQKQPRPHCPIGYLAAAVTRVVAYCSRFSAPSVTRPPHRRARRACSPPEAPSARLKILCMSCASAEPRCARAGRCLGFAPQMSRRDDAGTPRL